jgi:hypothetical protein
MDMSTAIIEQPTLRDPSHSYISQQVLRQLGTPPLYSHVIVRELWRDGAKDDMRVFYRVNIYAFTGESGVVPRMKMSDSLFVRCAGDNRVTGIEKKYSS